MHPQFNICCAGFCSESVGCLGIARQRLKTLPQRCPATCCPSLDSSPRNRLRTRFRKRASTIAATSMPYREGHHEQPDWEAVSDHSLLRRLREGSEDAATQLYRRYACRLDALTRANTARDLAPRVDSEDIVQSVFRTFFRRVTAGGYDVPDGEELWKLFLVIGLNKIRAV